MLSPDPRTFIAYPRHKLFQEDTMNKSNNISSCAGIENVLDQEFYEEDEQTRQTETSYESKDAKKDDNLRGSLKL